MTESTVLTITYILCGLILLGIASTWFIIWQDNRRAKREAMNRRLDQAIGKPRG